MGGRFRCESGIPSGLKGKEKVDLYGGTERNRYLNRPLVLLPIVHPLGLHGLSLKTLRQTRVFTRMKSLPPLWVLEVSFFTVTPEDTLAVRKVFAKLGKVLGKALSSCLISFRPYRLMLWDKALFLVCL